MDNNRRFVRMASIRSGIGESMEENYNEAIAEVRFNMSTIGLKESSVEKVVKARDLVIKALEKQIPNKVKYSRLYATTPDMNCPVCNKVLLTDYPNFCSDCGKRLDWSDSNE